MKKLIIFIFSVLTLVSCVQKTNNSTDLTTNDSTKANLTVNSTSTTNSLGIWTISHYVDEFGEPTKDGFILGSTQGTFSNSATEGSDLNVDLLIDNESKISIQLYEYAGSNPVKSGISENYRIKIKSSDGNTATLNAYNGSDRLTLDKKDSKILSSFLLKGGKLSFYIVEVSEYSSSNYKFEINDTSGFDKALSQLGENKK